MSGSLMSQTKGHLVNHVIPHVPVMARDTVEQRAMAVCWAKPEASPECVVGLLRVALAISWQCNNAADLSVSSRQGGDGSHIFVTPERLAYARHLLVWIRATQSIGAIAYASGFGDLSHFNHAFRRRYGTTPSDARRERPA